MIIDDDINIDEQQPAARELTVDDIARQVWIEARSGLTPLDSERAVKALAAAIGKIRDDYQLRMESCEHRANEAHLQVSHQKLLNKKMLQLVRGGYECCPVCNVGDTQKHREHCWLRQLATPVWTKQTTADRRLSQAHAARKKKGPRKGKGQEASSVA